MNCLIVLLLGLVVVVARFLVRLEAVRGIGG